MLEIALCYFLIVKESNEDSGEQKEINRKGDFTFIDSKATLFIEELENLKQEYVTSNY